MTDTCYIKQIYFVTTSRESLMKKNIKYFICKIAATLNRLEKEGKEEDSEYFRNKSKEDYIAYDYSRQNSHTSYLTSVLTFIACRPIPAAHWLRILLEASVANQNISRETNPSYTQTVACKLREQTMRRNSTTFKHRRKCPTLVAEEAYSLGRS